MPFSTDPLSVVKVKTIAEKPTSPYMFIYQIADITASTAINKKKPEMVTKGFFLLFIKITSPQCYLCFLRYRFSFDPKCEFLVCKNKIFLSAPINMLLRKKSQEKRLNNSILYHLPLKAAWLLPPIKHR